ncbi:gliding motility protein GldL [Ornithobacterium rhinotracheale]|uniref:Gliding motility-associated protein GldL n=1 Tax=Ornithobacterium rhinotracheale (strain ATCC 51463 / DSM 15997 / CCUG 23171 / CIP 104009 / LMG 9086) TaxID=867902 RepID=I4A0X5_ORNRL|nr:gliding motility protein GldL [Ornithobacterium rhinotracheale]AFL97609.1 gliding motility-associated protein GldL [Ornithobacterium rhinotracheale DSM 15997]AIP98881.1 gliding motility protein GldL [Ornithobacterium rhinotracheale ORT-UMN 88]KGB66840.1 gliding motility protein GldL [Ornithobacterium rhinotracheale H06-030791]MBN3661841.1 gliding motility protein GldL [Ornithobacterium rhinotracheale]MCK0194999.1 gliding motility protein GldL [Ornithobacterium rhinotracheale]
MAAKTKKKDVILNMVYSLGAAVVIIGALFKINHWGIGPINGSLVLAIGLGVEALIFIVFAFDPPAGEYDWEKAYPELADPNAKPVARKQNVVADSGASEASLSAKLDKMLADAKLDAALMTRLKDGINSFSNTVEEMNKTVDASRNTQKYGDQLALAANHMESLNSLYQVQLENGKKQVELNQKFINEMQKSASGSEQFMAEMNKLTKNVNDLNKVYGGMLSAMRQPNV